jgi:hypothetical protein
LSFVSSFAPFAGSSVVVPSGLGVSEFWFSEVAGVGVSSGLGSGLGLGFDKIGDAKCTKFYINKIKSHLRKSKYKLTRR